MLKLKSAFFGYNKTDVCDYIDGLTNDISKKYENEINTLTKQNEELKKQLEDAAKGDETAVVSGIIIEAQRFAEGLRNKAIAENEALTSKNEAAAKQVAEHIQSCEDKLAMLKNSIHQVLADTDNTLTRLQQELSALHDQTKI